MPNQKIFPISRYDELVAETMQKVVELGKLKGGEYSGDIDRLANFRRNGEKWGVTMEQCWGIYVSKHYDAIVQYVDDLAKGKVRDRMESLEGRVDDIITYMLLFKAMLREREDAVKEVTERNTNPGARIMPHADESDLGG